MITHNRNNDFTGYLGNRMFQTASTIGIATKYNQPYCFNSSEYLAGFKNILCVPNSEFGKYQFNDVQENSFGFQTVNLESGRHYNILGYRQTEKYFEHCKELIKTTFEFNDEIKNVCNIMLSDLKENNPDKNLVSIHVRCGDYLNLKNHHTCLMDVGYYEKAVLEFDLDQTIFVIFSDNLNMAADFFRAKTSIKFVCAAVSKPVIDMCLMSMLDGHIIANSSFSWWAAWLSGNKTISPDKNKWFGSAYDDMEINDIIPEAWKQIK